MKLIFALLSVLFLAAGCAAQGNPIDDGPRISLGEVKVSFFQLAQGKQSGQPIGVYTAIISREWNFKNGNKLNEIFEQVTGKEITVLDDKSIGMIFDYLNQEKYFELPETPLSSFDLSDLKSTNYATKVITVDINGVKRSICFEKLPVIYRPVFNRIQQVIFAAIGSGRPKAVIQMQDPKELIEQEIGR